MKQLTTAIFLMVLCICANSQIIDRTKDKAKDKSNQRIDRRIDEGLDKSLDKIEGIFKKKDKTKKGDSDSSTNKSPQDSTSTNDSDRSNSTGTPSSPGSFPAGLFGGGSVEVESSYSFQHNIDMRIDMYGKKGDLDQTMYYTYFLTDDLQQIGVDGGMSGTQVQMVYEVDKQRMISMTTTSGTKMGFVMDTKDVTEIEDDSDDTNFTKTGREKIILNLLCEEWVGAEDEYDYVVWIAKDSRLAFASAYASMTKADKKNSYGASGYPEGTMMLMTMTNRKSGEKTEMQVTAINENSPSTISTEGYEFYNFGGGGR